MLQYLDKSLQLWSKVHDLLCHLSVPSETRTQSTRTRIHDYFLLHQLIEFPYEAAGLILELQYPFQQFTCVITVPTLPTLHYSYR